MKAILAHPVFRFLSSLKLAVTVILSLAAVLAVATICESLYGMRAVYILVYGTWWFAGLLTVLGTNVLCAALSRYPWKKHQTGFVVTHAGILTILLGSFLTQQWGVDGNLPVSEGSDSRDVVLNDLILTVSGGEGSRDLKFPESALRQKGRLFEIELGKKKRILVDDFIPRATLERRYMPSPIPGVGLPAIRVELFNNRFRVDEWLQPKQPDQATEVNLGPAILSFRKLWTEKEEARWSDDVDGKNEEKLGREGTLIAELGGREYKVLVAQAREAWQPVDRTGLQIRVEKYFPYAIVKDGALVNKAPEPMNPAVMLRIRGPAGAEEQHTIFALFPEFATLHKSSKKKDVPPLGVKFRLIAAGPGAELAENRPRGSLHFALSADGRRLLYRVKKGSGATAYKAEGTAKIGDEIATGWMDLRFKVTEFMAAGVEEEAPTYVETITGDAGFFSAMHVRVEDMEDPKGVKPQLFWLVEGMAKNVQVGGREYTLTYGKRRLQLPFALYLKQFRMGTDPGTRKAASYESTVSVGKGGPTAEISMNEPLVHGGYTFYQASYSLEEGRPPLSIFSVNRDPGRWVKYFGSIIMCLGIALMFYMNPHYWNKIYGLGKKEEGAHS